MDPTSLLLSRQSVAFPAGLSRRSGDPARRLRFLRSPGGPGGARAVVIATGSELPIAMQAQQQLEQRGIAVRVVSMPSTTVFDRQSEQWKSSVLPEGLPRLAIEAGVYGLLVEIRALGRRGARRRPLRRIGPRRPRSMNISD